MWQPPRTGPQPADSPGPELGNPVPPGPPHTMLPSAVFGWSGTKSGAPPSSTGATVGTSWEVGLFAFPAKDPGVPQQQGGALRGPGSTASAAL